MMLLLVSVQLEPRYYERRTILELTRNIFSSQLLWKTLTFFYSFRHSTKSLDRNLEICKPISVKKCVFRFKKVTYNVNLLNAKNIKIGTYNTKNILGKVDK